MGWGKVDGWPVESVEGRAMKVLVTGAFGRLGQEGIVRLLAEGHSVIAFDVPNRRNHKEARRFEGRVQTV